MKGSGRVGQGEAKVRWILVDAEKMGEAGEVEEAGEVDDDDAPFFIACSASLARSACSSSFAFAFADHSDLSHCFRAPLAWV